MLLRTSISKYKKFFQKTLTNFKSLFSPTYQKIPKTPLHNNHSYNDLEKFYNDFTEKWDSENRKTKKRSKNKLMQSSPSTLTTKQEETKQEEEEVDLHNHNHNEMEKKQEEFEEKKNKRKLTHIQRGKKQDSSSSTSNSKSIVEKKMKELEMLETSNMDYILDIEEVLHYYTRLTCPSYVEIVDKFFMEMYSEFLDCPKTPTSVNSKLQKM